MSVVTLNGEIIHYEVLGRGKPLMLLHSWIGSWRYWIPTMQAASISYRAYAIDLWGFGDTAKKTEMYSLERQVSLLDGFLDSLGIGKVAFVGHGLGAVIAMSYAQRYPNIVDRIIATGYPLSNTAINPKLQSAPISELVEWLLGRLPENEAARVEAPKADQQAILTSLNELDRTGLGDLTENVINPCLFVYGQNDPAVELPTEDVLTSLSDQMHYIVFEQSGHFPMLDEPSKFNRLLSDFLSLESGESPRKLQLKEEWKRRVR
jgi:pimeloyl-ACP methyl ester carboxylesterase